jgi:DNA-binding phage protein
MPTKSYEELLIDELRDPDLAAEYLTVTLSKRSVSALKGALGKVIDSHGGADVIQEVAGLSADEIEGILGAEAEIKIRPLQALLKALGLGISFYPEEPGSGS